MPKSRPSSKKAPRLAEWNGLSTYDARAVEPLFRLLSGLSAGCWQATEYLQGEEGNRRFESVDGFDLQRLCACRMRFGGAGLPEPHEPARGLAQGPAAGAAERAIVSIQSKGELASAKRIAHWRFLRRHDARRPHPRDRSALRRCHPYSVGRSSPGPVDAAVGLPQRLNIARSLEDRLVRAGRHSKHPAQSSTAANPLRAIQSDRPSSSTVAYSGPRRSSAEAVITTSAPARRYLATSSEVSTRVVAANEARSRPCKRRSGVGAPVQQVRLRRHVPPRVAHARRPGRTSMTPRLTRLFDSRAPLAGALLVTRSSRCVGPRSTRRGEGRDRR